MAALLSSASSASPSLVHAHRLCAVRDRPQAQARELCRKLRERSLGLHFLMRLQNQGGDRAGGVIGLVQTSRPWADFGGNLTEGRNCPC